MINLLANVGDIEDAGLIPGVGRSLGGGNGNPLQYSSLDNPRDREGWWATVQGVAGSQTQLSTHAHSVLTLCTKDCKGISPKINNDQQTYKNMLNTINR